MIKQKLYLYILMFIGLIFLSLIIYSETSILVFHPGQLGSKNIVVIDDNFVSDDVVLVKLERNTLTPSTLDFVYFENGKSFIYSLIEGDGANKLKVYFDVPKDYLPGTYSVLYFINGEFKEESGELSFKVV